MKTTVLKFELEMKRLNVLECPEAVRPLDVQVQRGWPTLWIEVDQDGPPRKYGVLCRPTSQREGHERTGSECYLNTTQLADGTVWHWW